MTDFIDVAYHEGVIDWPLVLSQPHIDGGIVKCGDGYLMPTHRLSNGLWYFPRNPINHYDPCFVQNWRGLARAKLRGAYWFVRLNFDRRPFDPEASMKGQAKLFYQKMAENGLFASDFIVADIEQDPKQIAYLSNDQKTARIREFLDECEGLFRRKLVIYTYPSWWESQIGASPWALQHKLWIADYTPPTWIPKPWRSYWAHQYSDKGRVPGVESAADLNNYGPDIKAPENPDRNNPELMAHLRFQEQRILRLEQRVEALEGK